MWKRNLLFLGLVGGGILTLGANLMPPREPKLVTHYDASAYQTADFLDAVAKIDASFQRQWSVQKTQPAPTAPDLAVARRLALGLMGTVPSLEEVRQLERLPAGERLAWWIDHILQDRRFADYFAERLARACVGTEDGPFIFYRRRRFVDWLGDQVADRPALRPDRPRPDRLGRAVDRPAGHQLRQRHHQARREEPARPDPPGRPRHARLPRPAPRLRRVPQPPLRRVEADRLPGAGRVLRPDAPRLHRHLRRRGRVQGDQQARRTGKAGRRPARALRPGIAARPTATAASAWPRGSPMPKNPYFARAAVNRVWALLLGRPLSSRSTTWKPTPRSRRPCNCWRTTSSGHGFDLRRLIRVIAGTEVFRLDSASDRDLTEADEKAWAVFPLTRLRPEQVMGGVSQASSVTTIDAESHILVRLVRIANQNDFVKRYGDSGEDEFDGKGGTIPQRLLMMNGSLIHDRITDNPFNASMRIAWLAPDDARAVESAYLAVLTRRPTPGRGRALSAVPGRREPETDASARGPVLDAHQLDGVLMEPLSMYPPHRREFLALRRPGGGCLADAGGRTCWPAPPRRAANRASRPDRSSCSGCRAARASSKPLTRTRALTSPRAPTPSPPPSRASRWPPAFRAPRSRWDRWP